jgi:type I restriction enzyme R subunit
MSQIVDYDDKELEKLALFSRHLRPMLREKISEEDEIDLGNVTLSHYRLSKIREQDLKLNDEAGEYGLDPSNDVGSAKAKDKKEEYLSIILRRLNDLFITDELTDGDMLHYLQTVADKVGENERVMHQIRNNASEQAFLGDFPQAVDDAVMDSSDAHQNQMMQYLSSPQVAQGFAREVFNMLIKKS